jgi:hypothetical protein
MSVLKSVLAAIAILLMVILMLVSFSFLVGFCSQGVGNAYSGVKVKWLLFACIPAASGVVLYWACKAVARFAWPRDAQAAPPVDTISSLLQRPAALVGWTVLWLGIACFCFTSLRKFNFLLSKRGEGATKGNLGAIRSALSIYYGDMEGQYPRELSALTVGGKYMFVIPNVFTCGEGGPECGLPHGTVNEVVNYPSSEAHDTGKWAYVNNTAEPNFGTIIVDCTHTDTKGTVWTVY